MKTSNTRKSLLAARQGMETLTLSPGREARSRLLLLAFAYGFDPARRLAGAAKRFLYLSPTPTEKRTIVLSS
jgi:hypothetical protein